jgi:DNA-binding IclR family transcriptional regulator
VAYAEKVSAQAPVADLCPARLPAHATALGKALLAFTPPPSVTPVLSGQLRRYTPRTVTEPERLRLQLRTVRATRLALCDGELEPGWRAVAMPVLVASGNLVAALELRVRDLARDVPAWRPALAVAAGALARELEHREDRCPVQPVSLIAPAGTGRSRPRLLQPVDESPGPAGSAAGLA